jgi:hypothetical protein
LQLTGAGVLYNNFTWAAAAAATPGALNNNQTFGGTTCGTGPVIPTELRFTSTPVGCNLPGGLFSIEVCATNSSGFVAISYNSPITISLISGPGVLSGTTTQNALFGCATFPGISLSAAGTYQFRATDGVRSDTSAFVYISPTCATCPNLNAVLVDACGVQEGRNEILFFNSGNFAIPVNTTWTMNYGSGNPPATGYMNSVTSNQNYINALNAAAGCNLFYDGLSSSPIPPNTNFIVMSYTPLTTYNFSAWCTLGSVYVIFSNDPDWDTTSGNWKNCLDCGLGGNGLDPRYFRSNFSGLTGGPTCDFTYSYIPCTDLLCLGNGDGIDFGYGGGTPTASWNECTPNNVLAVEFEMTLQAHRDGGDVYLDWQTLTESNSDHFVLQRSLAATGPFEEIGSVPAAGVSFSPRNYHWIDTQVSSQQLWYRLTEIDANGQSSVSHIATVAATIAKPAVRVAADGRMYTFDIAGTGAVRLDLMDAAGRQVLSRVGSPGKTTVDLQALATGVYCYRVVVGMDAFTGKIALMR